MAWVTTTDHGNAILVQSKRIYLSFVSNAVKEEEIETHKNSNANSGIKNREVRRDLVLRCIEHRKRKGTQ